jgi:hypothetical protein
MQAALKSIDEFHLRFPHAVFRPELRLITWFPSGVLDDNEADRVIEFLEAKERLPGPPFNRFTDLTGYTSIEISLDHIVRLARRRKQGYRGPRVKSAFYALRLLGVKIAALYEELMQGSRIEVSTFRDRATAAEWLGVPAQAVSAPRARKFNARIAT